jgi:NAD(P)-dependent dehydrogenase (short-subunit alcohol dehydrogenase family)
MTMSVSGKHALVTGGGSGIGSTIALALAEAGAIVTVCGRRRQQLDEMAAQHKNIRAETADVTDQKSIAQLYGRGPFDIVIANAGGAQSAPAEKISAELWSNTLNVNLTGAFFSVQPALSGMRAKKWGRIVFIASTAGIRAAPYIAPYVAAKHGVIGLMRTLALETAKDGITVNAICPSYTETPMLEQAVARIVATTKRSEAEARAALAAKNPQGRFITPQEVADTVLWLCSDGAASITGQAISLSGGETW